MQILEPLGLLHVLNMEHLIVKVRLVEYKANSYTMSKQGSLTHFLLM